MLITLIFAAVCSAAPLEAWSGGELGDGRMVGMGGAYVAVAETGGATLENPASLAVRRPLRADTRVQLDGSLLAIGIRPTSARPFAPAALDGDDPNLLAAAGGLLKLGPTAVGVHGVRFGYAYDADPDDGGAYDRLQHGLLAIGGARAFGGGAVVVGALAHANYATVTRGEAPVSGRSFRAVSLGPGATVGAVLAPPGSRLRAGARARTPSRATPLDLADEVEVVWPAQAAVGVAWSTTPTTPATYGRGEAPEREGRYLLLAADLEVTGPSDGADLRALIEPDLPAGAPTTVSVQVGGEEEVLPHRLTLRAGGYNEPGRFAGVPSRLHLTAGLAAYVGEWPRGNGIRLGTGVDVAPGWLRVAVGIGAW